MERRVLISHVTDDPEWAPDQVEAVALAIQQAGIRVSLDVWHQRDFLCHLSLDEWQGWIDESMDAATHILCLVSTHYRELWSLTRDLQGGYGVPFESIRLIHLLYMLKQRNDGRILTLRPEGSGKDCIPLDLVLDCPSYRWGADRVMLLSHVGEAVLSVRTAQQDHVPDATTAPALPAVPLTELASAIREPAQATRTLTLAAKPYLPWASDSGEDRYGRWADLTINGATQRMRWIPPSGAEGFWMGERHSYLSREVVSRGFWLADTPCTQAFWQAVTGNNPSHFKQGAHAPERPVENVSWDDVMKQFITRFEQMPGWGLGCRIYLPTEVEWEYAARADTHWAYWWGDRWYAARGNARDAVRDNADVTGKPWWGYAKGTTPVHRFLPNPWGLYDMHGNVGEWCADVWKERCDVPEAGPDQSFRVVRGGSWFSNPDFARAASRLRWNRGFATQYRGFRFVLRSPADK
ncbi:MAG: SUMF1/EgtB/PvdO family nonheme iron enzyme [Pseudomonadota bacterium]